MQRWSMITSEEIHFFFFFSLWPIPYFLGNIKQNSLLQQILWHLIILQIQLYNMFEDTLESLLKSLITSLIFIAETEPQVQNI